MDFPQKQIFKNLSNSEIIYFALFTLAFSGCLVSLILGKTEVFVGICFWTLFLALFFISRPGSDMHRKLRNTLYEKVLILLIALLTILYCILPMGFLPAWNGKYPEHRNQYELLTEAFLDGKLYIEYGDEEDLLALNNPYDPEEREETGVRHHWDHAFYNGRYYVYFGVVPVLLVFLPYRILTGVPLNAYRATQLFAIGIITGIFCLFWQFKKHYFKKLTLGMYLLLSCSLSLVSVWYASTSPALYCTAITAGLCTQIWSIFCFCKGVLFCQEENNQLRYAFFAALLGALTFGCRPPIGLANILVLPLLYLFLKQRPFTKKLLVKLCLAALPYLLLAIGLMAYNYVRFNSILEFGQSYQITVTDQRNMAAGLSFIKIYNAFLQNFFEFHPLTEEFPHVSQGGVFLNFPILLFCFVGIIPQIREKVRERKLWGFVLTLFAAMAIITLADVLGAPYLMERYRMDIYFLAAIACFLMIGFWHETMESSLRKRSCFIMHLCVVTILIITFHYFNEVSINYPEFIAYLESAICFWRFL